MHHVPVAPTTTSAAPAGPYRPTGHTRTPSDAGAHTHTHHLDTDTDTDTRSQRDASPVGRSQRVPIATTTAHSRRITSRRVSAAEADPLFCLDDLDAYDVYHGRTTTTHTPQRHVPHSPPTATYPPSALIGASLAAAPGPLRRTAATTAPLPPTTTPAPSHPPAAIIPASVSASLASQPLIVLGASYTTPEATGEAATQQCAEVGATPPPPSPLNTHPGSPSLPPSSGVQSGLLWDTPPPRQQPVATGTRLRQTAKRTSGTSGTKNSTPGIRKGAKPAAIDTVVPATPVDDAAVTATQGCTTEHVSSVAP